MSWFCCCIKKEQYQLEQQLLTQTNDSLVAEPKKIKTSIPPQTSNTPILNTEMIHDIPPPKKQQQQIKEHQSPSILTPPVIPKKIEENQRLLAISAHKKTLKRVDDLLMMDRNARRDRKMRYKSFRKYSGASDKEVPEKKSNIEEQVTENKELEDQVASVFSRDKEQEEIQQMFGKSTRVDYICSNVEGRNPFYFSFKCRKHKDIKQPLQYYFQKCHNKLICLIGRQMMINSKIDTLRKSNELIWTINFGNEPGALYELSIDTNRIKCMIMKKMERIFVLVQKTKSFKQQLDYIMEIVKTLSQKEKKRLILFFPPSTSIHKISTIMKSIYGEEIDKIDIQRFINQYTFTLDYFESSISGIGTVVKLHTLDNAKKNLYYDSIKTALSIFGKHFNNERYYYLLREFYNLIKRRPAKDLGYLRKLFDQNPKQFMTKVREVRNWEGFQLLFIENQNYLAHFPWQITENDLILNEYEQQKITKHYERQERKQPNTPVNEEWDQYLVQSDIKLPRKETSQNYIRYDRLDSIANDEIINSTIENEDLIEEELGLRESELDENMFEGYETDEQEMYEIKQITELPYSAEYSTRKRSWDL